MFRWLENVRQISKLFFFFILYLLEYIAFWKLCFDESKSFRIEVRIRHVVLLRGVGFWLPGFHFLCYRGFQLELFKKHYVTCYKEAHNSDRLYQFDCSCYYYRSPYLFAFQASLWKLMTQSMNKVQQRLSVSIWLFFILCNFLVPQSDRDRFHIKI
jgi:hypothetical protein